MLIYNYQLSQAVSSAHLIKCGSHHRCHCYMQHILRSILNIIRCRPHQDHKIRLVIFNFPEQELESLSWHHLKFHSRLCQAQLKFYTELHTILKSRQYHSNGQDMYPDKRFRWAKGKNPPFILNIHHLQFQCKQRILLHMQSRKHHLLCPNRRSRLFTFSFPMSHHQAMHYYLHKLNTVLQDSLGT